MSGEQARTDRPATSGFVRCEGCHALVPAIEGPTHGYIGATAGCWAIYMEIVAREFGEYRYPECHRLTVDTYAVQHPGVPSRQSIQSVGGHLVSLYLVLEKGLPAQKATRALARTVDRSSSFLWLTPPMVPEWLAVLDVRGARDLAEHEQRVQAWATSVWRAWSEHHEIVRRWARIA